MYAALTLTSHTHAQLTNLHLLTLLFEAHTYAHVQSYNVLELSYFFFRKCEKKLQNQEPN